MNAVFSFMQFGGGAGISQTAGRRGLARPREMVQPADTKGGPGDIMAIVPIQGLWETHLIVADLDRSIGFYRDAAGGAATNHATHDVV